MLIITGFPYSGNKWTVEKFEALKEIWPCMDKEAKPPSEDKSAFHWEHVFPTPQRMTMEEVAAINALGIQVKIEGVDGTQLTKMKDRDRWTYEDEIDGEALRSGKAVQITIADFALLRIDEVTWLDDACTQEVQSSLDEGWRILAVCPPNAARRPDYILGRCKAGKVP